MWSKFWILCKTVLFFQILSFLGTILHFKVSGFSRAEAKFVLMINTHMVNRVKLHAMVTLWRKTKNVCTPISEKSGFWKIVSIVFAYVLKCNIWIGKHCKWMDRQTNEYSIFEFQKGNFKNCQCSKGEHTPLALSCFWQSVTRHDEHPLVWWQLWNSILWLQGNLIKWRKEQTTP